jgi:anion-transporting  ArsA/GET3 family ATPase
MRTLLDHRLLLLAGKGGVGRTTCAAVIACAAARMGKRVLLAQTNAPERLGRLLGHPTDIGPHVVPVRENIWAVNMVPRLALREYVLQVLRYETLYQALFENKAMRSFLGAFPGIDYWAMLGKAWWHATEMAGGRPRYDLVLLDGPASGHALAMLRIPDAVKATMPKGPLGRDAEKVQAFLRDPQRFSVLLVALPEELPARETVDLAHALQGELRMPTGPLIVNGMPPAEAVDPSYVKLVDASAAPLPGSHLAPILAGASVLAARRRDAEKIMLALAERPGLPILELPKLPTNDVGPAEIEHLAGLLVSMSA